MSGFAWVTLATNDSYSLGALVLGHALKQASTIGQLVVLVTPGVTPSMRAKLSAVFNVVQEVNILDSKDETNLRLLRRPELGVTFTKLHCWRLTQFEKCVFLDADTLILSNCDELFQREEFSAAPDVGWPDCFNSGVFVFKPSLDTYESLIKFALENGSFDGGDQGLLNLFFSDWAHKDIRKRLPFIYNMCSVASYSYLPAFKQYGGQVKIIHFIGVTKPWLQYFETESKQVQPTAGMEHLKQHLQLWWNIFCEQVHPVLTPDLFSAAQKSSPDKRLEQSINYSPVPFNAPFTFPTIIPDPWLNYRTTDAKYNSHKPDEPHNTNAHQRKDISNEQIVHVVNRDSILPKELDQTIHFEFIENTDKDLDDDSESQTVTIDQPINIIPIDQTSPILIKSPASSDEKTIEDRPELHPDDNSEEGLASAFSQFVLGSPRSENQSALEDHLRRQSWEVGNIDYLGRDCFSNIWSKISETMADTERKEGQGIARTQSVAQPKSISAQEMLVCAKVTATSEQTSNAIGNQSSQVALNLQESRVEEPPPVTLKDILQPIAPREPISACEVPAKPSDIADETKVAVTCETKSIEAEVAVVCETKPAELKDTLVEEPKLVTSPSPVTCAISAKVVENTEPRNIILMEGVGSIESTPQALGPLCDKAVPICQKSTSSPSTPPACQKVAPEKIENTSESALPIASVCQKVCEKDAEVIEKPVDKPALIPEPETSPNLSTLTPLPVVAPEIPNNGSPVASTPTAVPLVSPSQEESTTNAPIAVDEKSIDVIEPSASLQPLHKSVDSPVSIEKQEECKASMSDLPRKPQDIGNKNNKNKKSNKNGKQDGKHQQPKSEKPTESAIGNKGHKDTKTMDDISSSVAKSEEGANTPIPLPPVGTTQNQEMEISVISPPCPIPELDVKLQQKVEEDKKQDETPIATDTTIPVPTEPKSSHETIKSGDVPAISTTVQDHKDKKTEKQKKDHGQGEKKAEKSKEHQKADNANNKEDKKGGDKQAKSDSKKDVEQKPEHQGKNGKKGMNKGDIKGKKENEAKSEKKVEPKSDNKSQQKVESRPDSSVESELKIKLDTKPEDKEEVKLDETSEQKEKPESKPQQKSDNKSNNKQGKDGKAEDKRKGGKEQKPQAPSPPKQKGKEQAVAPKQEAAAITPTTPAIIPVCPLPVQTPPIQGDSQVDVSKATKESPVVPVPEMSSTPSPQKPSLGCAKKETAPTPPPRKANNGGKKGYKKK